MCSAGSHFDNAAHFTTVPLDSHTMAQFDGGLFDFYTDLCPVPEKGESRESVRS